MKKVVTLDAVMVSFVSAIGYGVGMVVPGAFGMSPLICFVLCMVLGTVLDKLGNKIVFSSYVQQSNKRRYAVFAAVALLFLVVYVYMARFFAYSLWTDARTGLIYAVVIPLVAFFVTLGADALRRKKLLKKYGTGESGFQLDEEAEKLWKADLGTNAELSELPTKSPAVKTAGGTYAGKSDKSGVSFLGIPYAKADRWKAPEGLEPSDKIFEAFYFGPSEIQPENSHNILTRFPQSENCLSLNVWTAKLESGVKKPVFVWFHGGDGRYGGSANPAEHLKNLAADIPDAVFVSANYRLGVFGVIDFGNEAHPDSTALSLLDQIEALKWVKANIAAFGGDPENVTVAGANSGGSCITLLAAMQEAKSLFRRALVLCASTTDTPKGSKLALEAGAKLLEELCADCATGPESVTAEQLRDFSSRHYALLELPPRDGKLVPAEVEQAYLDGAASEVEFIFGIAADNASGWQAMTAGDISLDELEAQYYETLADGIGEEKRAGLSNLLQSYLQSGLNEEEAKSQLLSDFYYKACVLHDCRTLAKGGSKVRVFYWDVKGDIEKLTANSVSMVTTLLGNAEIAEQLGYLNDRDVGEIFRALLAKYLRGEDVSLYHNEIKGVDAVTWDSFSAETNAVLHIEKDCIAMDGDVFSENVPALEKLVFD